MLCPYANKPVCSSSDSVPGATPQPLLGFRGNIPHTPLEILSGPRGKKLQRRSDHQGKIPEPGSGEAGTRTQPWHAQCLAALSDHIMSVAHKEPGWAKVTLKGSKLLPTGLLNQASRAEGG